MCESLLGSDQLGSNRARCAMQALQAALPKTIRQRQERKAAYEVSRKQASSWTPLVKANREAANAAPQKRHRSAEGDHGCRARVTPRAGVVVRERSGRAAESCGHASTQAVLEVRMKHRHRVGMIATPFLHTRKLNARLPDVCLSSRTQSSSLMSGRTVQTEKRVSAQKMTPEEATRRQEAMAKNNALLFYQEQKAKRVKKIKSKAYHRHLKKQGEKARALLGNHTPRRP